MTAEKFALFSALLLCGTISGLFLGWTISVIPGTKLVDDRSYITTMQNINRAILNPAFMVNFLAPPFLLAVAAVLYARAGMQRRAWLLAVSAFTYAIGVFGVTMAGNVPLNNQLERFSLDDSDAGSLSSQRAMYEGPWNRWHNVRAAAGVVSFAVAAAASVVDDSTD